MEVLMLKNIFIILIIAFISGCTEVNETAFSQVSKDGDNIYITDKTGYRWDVTQAASIGFKPERFQYGIGKNTFVTLDDSLLSDNRSDVPQSLRIIGVSEESDAKAYSVSKLSRHEISNSTLGSKPIAVGY
jgi:hypothetical protein